jgi:hypothetical protein
MAAPMRIAFCVSTRSDARDSAKPESMTVPPVTVLAVKGDTADELK